MKITSIAITQSLVQHESAQRPLTPDELLVYVARVSNPNNQHNHLTGPKLLNFCMRHGHWSVFEMVDLTMEIETSRAIAAQILRHRSFSFQEFSQRYSPVNKLGSQLFETLELRPKHVAGNRQGSDEANEFPRAIAEHMAGKVANLLTCAEDVYHDLLQEGVAPECARMVLPLATKTRLYMKGSVRSWVHYLEQRTSPHAQKEHREVANAIRAEFSKHFPTVHAAMAEQKSEVESLKSTIKELDNK